MMKLADFDFPLPEDLIAQYPAERRDGSRLMVVERTSGAIVDRQFSDLPGLLGDGDLLVVNDTRVVPARLFGCKTTGGRVEVFLVRRLTGDDECWVCMTRSSKPLRPGQSLDLAGGIRGEVLGEAEEGLKRIRFACEGRFADALERAGTIPLPPYIRRAAEEVDKQRYQTIFARHSGSLAAPTAGLHFTDEVFAALARSGVRIVTVTLHVGLGTFLPVRTEDLGEHRMHFEEYTIPEETASAVNRAKAEGRRVVALGTTTTRTLEAAAGGQGRVTAGSGTTDLFILPGYRFRVVDALVTNFHLPKSTLLMLVSAFAGRSLVLQAYQKAVAERYRFFSYGDCMLLV